jgi:creatinine amidohydrolase
MDLGSLTTVDVGPHPLLLIPLGSCEQHGPHLPLDTDTRIAVAVAMAASEGRADVLVSPPITIGASGEHAGFAGTLSIGSDVLSAVLIELARSADLFRALVVINGHGGNEPALRRAVSAVAAEGRRMLAWSPRPDRTEPIGMDSHAGHAETSLLLHLCPELVVMDRAVVGRREPLPDLWPQLRAEGMAAVSPNGVLGDPTAASAARGAELFRSLVDDLVGRIRDWDR